MRFGNFLLYHSFFLLLFLVVQALCASSLKGDNPNDVKGENGKERKKGKGEGK